MSRRLLAAHSFGLFIAAAVSATPASGIYQGEPATAGYPELVHVGNACTGVLIGGNAAITAQHCVGSQPRVWLYSFQWTPSNALLREQAGVVATDNVRDLALLCLNNSVSVPIHTDLSGDVPFAGEIVEIAGFGAFRKGDVPAGRLHLADNLILPKKGKSRIAAVEPETFLVDATDTAAPSSACHGDSGGPAYVDGSKHVIGIARQHSAADRCGEPARYTRVDAEEVRRWIDQSLRTCSHS